jgi:glyoxylase-like metal-dependent hydrolase (beta-lactamase superfamily II)
VTEPPEIADRVEEVCAGVWHWRVHNRNIGGGVSSSQAVADGSGGTVLVDPVGLAPEVMADLLPVTAIVLTSKGHQRAAWRYHSELGAEVWMPAGAPQADEEPDHRYGDGDSLPGGLQAVLTPGPAPVHFCLLREADPGVLICADLLMQGDDGGLRPVPASFHDDPDETRRSLVRLAGLPFTVLCLDHGVPVIEGGAQAIRDMLATSE